MGYTKNPRTTRLNRNFGVEPWSNVWYPEDFDDDAFVSATCGLPTAVVIPVLDEEEQEIDEDKEID